MKLNVSFRKNGGTVLAANFNLFSPRSSIPAVASPDSLNVTVPFTCRDLFFHTSKHIGLKVLHGSVSSKCTALAHDVVYGESERMEVSLPTCFYEFSRGVWPFLSTRTCAVLVNAVRHLYFLSYDVYDSKVTFCGLFLSIESMLLLDLFLSILEDKHQDRPNYFIQSV
jgi:hypothetical protein